MKKNGHTIHIARVSCEMAKLYEALRYDLSRIRGHNARPRPQLDDCSLHPEEEDGS
jgi:hypothetical protein